MYNRILLIGLIAWTLAQILKVIIFWIINKRFERKVLGDLSPERFATMLATYEGEQAT